MHSRALVLFSGGQDSSTCLAWALDHYDYVETVGFVYGQRHAIEMTCRPEILKQVKEKFPKWREKIGVDHVLDLAVLGQISDTALTRDKEIIMADQGLPSTFVPGRNLAFLILACALAYRRELSVLVSGVCETDFSGYPDCRDDTLKALQVAVNLGMHSRLLFETPLMWLNKASTWQLAEDLGKESLIEIIRTHTHTCYLGERGVLHDWGYGCSQCPACKLRQAGYEQWQDSKQV